MEKQQPSGAPPPPAARTAEGGGAPQAANKFTIQIELVCQQSSLQKAMNMGGASVWSAPISYRGQQCHRVFFGRYATRAEAEAATSQVPSMLRASKPVVVAIP